MSQEGVVGRPQWETKQATLPLSELSKLGRMGRAITPADALNDSARLRSRVRPRNGTGRKPRAKNMYRESFLALCWHQLTVASPELPEACLDKCYSRR